jgi:phosphate transport system permease protein
MIVGSIMVTFVSLLLGVPISLGCAIFLTEIAPDVVKSVVNPAIELLAGIPSVVYGLFGIVVLVNITRNLFDYTLNDGFGILSAGAILAVMILPTITAIAKDAINAVPSSYKHGSLALGATKWQTIVGVTLPAARSGIVAAIILGIGRALGETMAMIMVIGNAINMPDPIVADHPLTIFLSKSRTLTGNIAVEISYATGLHADALFATGIVLFIMIMLVNTSARILLRERN